MFHRGHDGNPIAFHAEISGEGRSDLKILVAVTKSPQDSIVVAKVPLALNAIVLLFHKLRPINARNVLQLAIQTLQQPENDPAQAFPETEFLSDKVRFRYTPRVFDSELVNRDIKAVVIALQRRFERDRQYGQMAATLDYLDGGTTTRAGFIDLYKVYSLEDDGAITPETNLSQTRFIDPKKIAR